MSENERLTEDIGFCGATEESVVKFLENQFRCLEEEYRVEIFLEDKEDASEKRERRLCVNYAGLAREDREEVQQILESLIPALLSYGRQQYIEQQLMKGRLRSTEDPLTGMFSREYMINRADVLTRAEIFPTSVIAVRLKGYRNLVENYGKETGDSLVQLAASILAKAADKDYLIGRMAADVFVVLIALVREGEMEQYCKAIEDGCQVYEDSVFSPRLELGIAAARNKNEDVNEKIREAMDMLSL